MTRLKGLPSDRAVATAADDAAARVAPSALAGASGLRLDMGDVCSFRIDGRAPVSPARLAAACEPYELRPTVSRTGPPKDGMARPANPPIEADVSVHWVPVENASPCREIQGDAGDGRLVARCEDAVLVVEGSAACTIPETLGRGAALRVSGRYPLRRLLNELAWPLLQHAALDHGGVAIHGSGVAFGQDGVLLTGWAESGKTEVGLALLEAGAAFVSDKWTLVARDGRMLPFPGRVALRPWMAPHVPRLGQALATRSRIWMWAADKAARVLPAGDGDLGWVPAGDLLLPAWRKALALGLRGRIDAAIVTRTYGRADPGASLRTLVSLVRVPDASLRAREADPGGAARRLAASAAYERRAFWELARRRDHLIPRTDGGGRPSSAAEQEHAIRLVEERRLRELLAGVTVLEVETPFPLDPGRLVDALERWL